MMLPTRAITPMAIRIDVRREPIRNPTGGRPMGTSLTLGGPWYKEKSRPQRPATAYPAAGNAVRCRRPLRRGSRGQFLVGPASRAGLPGPTAEISPARLAGPTGPMMIRYLLASIAL